MPSLPVLAADPYAVHPPLPPEFAKAPPPDPRAQYLDAPRRLRSTSKGRLMAMLMVLAVAVLALDARLGGDISDEVSVPSTMAAAAFTSALQASVPRVQCQSGPQLLSGTGFVVEPSPGAPVVVTAGHVVAPCAGRAVRLSMGGTTVTGTVLAVDAKLDAAVIETDYPMASLQMGTSPALRAPVVVLGYPGGVPDAVVEYGRILQVSDDELLMRVQVAAGNSGSPVVDEQRRVVGVVTALLESSLVETAAATPLSALCGALLDCAAG